MKTTHTLSVLVEDRPGVLARVSSLFSRRGFNIESLAVGPTELKGVSRMTILVSVQDFPLEQVTKQLNKLINVIKIVEQDPESSVSRELMMIKVRADASTRTEVTGIVDLFRAKVIDVSTESVTIEATGTTTACKVVSFRSDLTVPNEINDRAEVGDTNPRVGAIVLDSVRQWK